MLVETALAYRALSVPIRYRLTRALAVTWPGTKRTADRPNADLLPTMTL
jgi:hypothetical protein